MCQASYPADLSGCSNAICTTWSRAISGIPFQNCLGLRSANPSYTFILVSLIPAIEEVLADALTAAELNDRVIASQAFENNAYLLFGGVFSSGLSADIANGCFSRCFLLHDEIFQVDGKAYLNSRLQFVSYVLTRKNNTMNRKVI